MHADQSTPNPSGNANGVACADLLEVLGDAQAARLTAEKTEIVQRRDGYKITGFVLCSPSGNRCIIEMSAVRWINKDEMWWLMHESESPINTSNS